jgi:hypothetical protein
MSKIGNSEGGSWEPRADAKALSRSARRAIDRGSIDASDALPYKKKRKKPARCACGHSKRVHLSRFFGQCYRDGCRCKHFTEAA